MGDEERQRAPAPRATSPANVFDPAATPVPRRRILLLMGAGALAASGGLGVLLEACGSGSGGTSSASPPITVKLDLDPATLVPGTPTEVQFTLVAGGASVAASVWLVKRSDGEIVAFDPRCTHALCRYSWSSDTQRFTCHCHPGQFALDGTVLGGPPPRSLDRFPARVTATVLELDVPGNFATPRESL
jgi:Rieske Fe-S protein